MTTNPDSSAASAVKPFRRDDIDALTAAHDLMERWRRFLLTRFADYTHHAEVLPVGGAVALDPIDDVFARTNSGYGSYALADNWYRQMIDALSADTDFAAIVVEHRVSDDRGGRPTIRTYRLPLDFVFGEATTDNPEYAAFLRLKAQFETTPETAPESVAAESSKRLRRPLDKQRVEAARVLFLQSGSSDGINPPTREQYEHLALPENRDLALVAYDKAITSLMLPEHGGLGDVRRQVYEAVAALELDTSSVSRAAARRRTDETLRCAAANMVDVLPVDRRPRVDDILSDTTLAAQAYRDALAEAEAQGEAAGDLSSTSRLRSDIHGHAATLGLGTDALNP